MAAGRRSGSRAVRPFWAAEICSTLPVRRGPAKVRHCSMGRPFVLRLHQPEVPAEPRTAQVDGRQEVRKLITIDLNRVEGDVEFRLDVEDHIVRDSWCVGTMYRGYEQILVGRAPSDVLVIVPRICGICSTAQLYAGVRALEDAWVSSRLPMAYAFATYV